MFLKKDFIQIPLSNTKCFNLIYDDAEDLKLGIINLCDLLKKDVFLVQVMINDTLNERLIKKNQKVLRYKNFNCIIMQDINVLENVNLEEVRFMNIFAIEKKYILDDVERMVRLSSFNLGIDNYLEYTKIIIKVDKYDNSIILNLPMK